MDSDKRGDVEPPGPRDPSVLTARPHGARPLLLTFNHSPSRHAERPVAASLSTAGGRSAPARERRGCGACGTAGDRAPARGRVGVSQERKARQSASQWTTAGGRGRATQTLPMPAQPTRGCRGPWRRVGTGPGGGDSRAEGLSTDRAEGSAPRRAPGLGAPPRGMTQGSSGGTSLGPGWEAGGVVRGPGPGKGGRGMTGPIGEGLGALTQQGQARAVGPGGSGALDPALHLREEGRAAMCVFLPVCGLHVHARACWQEHLCVGFCVFACPPLGACVPSVHPRVSPWGSACGILCVCVMFCVSQRVCPRVCLRVCLSTCLHWGAVV